MSSFCVLFAIASEDDIEYRIEVMTAIGAHATSLRSILREKVPHTEHIGIHVNALADLASVTGTLFPKGSEGGESLPLIWEEPEEFRKAVALFETASSELRDTINAGDAAAISGKVRGLFLACRGCHDKYRE